MMACTQKGKYPVLMAYGAALCALFLFSGASYAASASLSGGGGGQIEREVEYVAEEPFTDDQTDMIRHNVTTKQEILDWFGPPLAIAERWSSLKVPQPALDPGEPEDVWTESLFERFAQGRVITFNLIIYYYHAFTMRQTVETPWPTSATLSTTLPHTLQVKKLWILIDTQTGRVVDHRLEHMEGTELGGKFIPRQKDPAGGNSVDSGADKSGESVR